MSKKKIAAILLGIIWMILLFDRYFFTSKETNQQPVQAIATARRDEARTTKDVKYPELRLSLTKKNLFTSPLQTIEDQKKEQETKKVITIPAPPMPILPEPKKVEEKEKSLEKQDPLADITLVGVLDKKSKKVAFIKQKREIKPFLVGEPLFDTKFFVEKIGANVVILKNAANEERKLEIIKEEKDDKK